ncbi:hypothetical protein [Glycomyces sp. YM15]|uniref:hypothetical protein n=1 Tax=Glycomyces sp. YM15 TaxID=2800446 RepID=UPI001964F25F|nr:hypothetical protein [Glycomyces sp. YM15]
MTNQSQSGAAREPVAEALDRSAAAIALPPTLAARMARLPLDLAQPESERQAVRLLCNVFAAEEGQLELRVNPEFDGTGPETIETHGAEVADVLARWGHAGQRGEVKGLLLHLTALILHAAPGMGRQMAENARAAIDAYTSTARSHLQAGPQSNTPITRRLAFLVPAVEMLNSAMRLASIVSDKRRGQEIADLVLSTARTYIMAEYVEDIGYVLSMMKALLIFPRVAPKTEVLTLLREGERICDGSPTHRIVVEALCDHPGLLAPDERRHAVEQWATAMMRTAAASSPNEAYALHLQINEFCHAHGISGGPIISQNSAAFVAVAPHLELQWDRMEVPHEIQMMLTQAAAVATQRIAQTSALEYAFVEIAMGPPPLPVKRELDDAGVEGIVLLPKLKLVDRNFPLRHVPLERVLPEQSEDRRTLTMLLGAHVPAAILDAIGEHFHPTVEEVEAVLPELHVQPENRRRLAKALCEYFAADADRIDNVQNEAAILLEGMAREVAHHLGVGTMKLPRLSGTEVQEGKFALLGSLLSKVRGTDRVDQEWLDSIEYLAGHPGVGLNLRNNAAHALGGRGQHRIAGLTLYANLYLASLLGFRRP